MSTVLASSETQIIMRYPRLLPLWQTLLVVLVFSLATGCAARKPVHPTLTAAAEQTDALAMYDALEALIDARTDTPADREYAYDTIRAREEDTAANAFARAAITGRLVQQKGLLGAGLVPDIERYARRSRELDPNFRDGAATRLLGTLYVVAPATFLKHGDSESGLELLEALVEAHPNALENHLRLAEAYIALGDRPPARPHLCRCLAHRTELRGDDQALLTMLAADVGPLQCPGDAPVP
jgi:hypothetical protein